MGEYFTFERMKGGGTPRGGKGSLGEEGLCWPRPREICEKKSYDLLGGGKKKEVNSQHRHL